MRRHSVPVFCFWSPLIAVDCCSWSKRRYYPQVLLQFDHSRRFSLLSAKILNLDAKCKCFGVYFLCLTKSFFERKFIFESANQADGGKKCRVCARFVGTAPFDIKRECEKNYANYTLNYTFRWYLVRCGVYSLRENYTQTMHGSLHWETKRQRVKETKSGGERESLKD